MFQKIKNFFGFENTKESIIEESIIEECDHCYFPEVVNGVAIGQKCAICDKFNSCDELGMKEFKI